jgi:hypothetical protein
MAGQHPSGNSENCVRCCCCPTIFWYASVAVMALMRCRSRSSSRLVMRCRMVDISSSMMKPCMQPPPPLASASSPAPPGPPAT